MESKLTEHNDLHHPKLRGLRMTRQCSAVYGVLVAHHDHPTTGEVFDRAKHKMPGISLATVYNCLEVLMQHGSVRQVNFERKSSLYCPNFVEYGHFHDEKRGIILDVPLKKGAKLSKLPEETQINHLEITLRGTVS